MRVRTAFTPRVLGRSLLSAATGLADQDLFLFLHSVIRQRAGRFEGTLKGYLVYLHTFQQNYWLIKTSAGKKDQFDFEILLSLSPGRNYTALLYNQL